MKIVAWKLVPGPLKRNSEETSILIWTNFDSFAITDLHKWIASKLSFSNRTCYEERISCAFY